MGYNSILLQNPIKALMKKNYVPLSRYAAFETELEKWKEFVIG